jgi:hypothetical protein
MKSSHRLHPWILILVPLFFACEMLDKLDLPGGLTSLFSNDPDEPDVRVKPSDAMAPKIRERALGVMVAGNDQQLRTFLEKLCLDLGFNTRIGDFEIEGLAEKAKEEWFDALVEDIGDRQERYGGVDLVVAAFTNEPIVSKQVQKTGQDGKKEKRVETEYQVEITIKGIEVGTKYVALHATSGYKRKHVDASEDEVRLKRAEILDKIERAMVPAILDKGFGGPSEVAAHAETKRAREASSSRSGS